MTTFSSNGEKPKSIIINGELHSQFKHFCKGKCLKIGGVIEDLIKVYLHDPNAIQHLINVYKDEENQLEESKIIREALKK